MRNLLVELQLCSTQRSYWSRARLSLYADSMVSQRSSKFESALSRAVSDERLSEIWFRSNREHSNFATYHTSEFADECGFLKDGAHYAELGEEQDQGMEGRGQ